MYTVSIKASFKFLETFDNRVSKFLGTYGKKVSPWENYHNNCI